MLDWRTHDRASREGSNMPGTRTAPTVDGTPDYTQVVLHWIDFTGDLRADSYLVPAAATDAQIEAFAVAEAAASNASLYQIERQQVYNSVGDKTNALEEVHDNVKTNLVIQAKNAASVSNRAYVPAPINTLFVDTTDSIDPASVPLGNILTAFLALLGAGWGIVGARLTYRRDRNEQVKI